MGAGRQDAPFPWESCDEDLNTPIERESLREREREEGERNKVIERGRREKKNKVIERERERKK